MKNTFGRLALRGLLLAILGLFYLGIASVPASAHTLSGKPAAPQAKVTPQFIPPPCTNSGCYGLDPYKTACGKASSYNTIYTVSAPVPANYTSYKATIYNKYSTWCRANWAEIVSNGNARIDIHNSYETRCFPNDCTTFYPGPNYPAWTDMIDGAEIAYACAAQPGGAPNYNTACVSQ
ncbi:DUF2690 domain-containing protein [Ktedonobacter racemifer]|uniref:Uncharacterized protein n=1 Tax=Ktedonobacter racemifer DSM 44963 TaxID=485913 RepID=D6TMP0_KTERA|nr:DUF2690 domain-containing protein [Ktedonobacter racemifer]EFH87040.1 hypothetical protein Krac_8361 [Ktedonobacter racemifer DSM 44963]